MENNLNLYYYDGSFNGFLTVLYDVEYQGARVEELLKRESAPDALFPEPNYIPARIGCAEHIWEKLRASNYSALKTLYFAFMSEEKGIENVLLRFFRTCIKEGSTETDISYHAEFHGLRRLANEVEKEKKTTERKLLIQESVGSPCVTAIRPKYNILPLISRYLRTRYRESEWVVFDLRRRYGLHHGQGNISFIPMSSEHRRAGNTAKQEASSKEGSDLQKKSKSRLSPVMA